MSWQAQAQTTRGSEAAAATTQAGSTQLATTTDQPDAKIMSSYLKATWTKHRAGSGKLTGSAAVGEIPPTDCPPQPVQVCQDSWKIKTINPFE
jgi:hypothetical protein